MSENNTDCASQRSENASTDVASMSSVKLEACDLAEEAPKKPRSDTLSHGGKSPTKRGTPAA